MLQRKWYDDGKSLKRGVAAAKKLARDGTKFVISHSSSDCAIPASDVYEDKGVIMMNPVATSPRLTARGHRLIFRTTGTDVAQASVACDWIAEKIKPSAKIAILYTKTIYSEVLATAVKSGLKDRGVGVVLYEGIEIAIEKDHSPTIERLVQHGVDFVYYSGGDFGLFQVMRQVRAAGIKARFMTSDTAAISGIESYAGDAIDGLLLTSPGPFDGGEHNSALAREMGDIAPAAFKAYAAVEVLAQEIAAAGDHENTSKIAQAIRSGTFDTCIGSLSFQPNGDLTSSDFVVEEYYVRRVVRRCRAYR